MIKQIVIPLILVAAFIAVVGIFVKKSPNISFPGMVPTATATPKNQNIVKLGDKEVQVEIASTEAVRSKGLGKRSSLGENSGMLFVFDQKNILPTFWMKDMQIGLDIIWIKGDKIASIDRNISPPATGTPDSQLSLYNPGQPIDYVLEVNSGFSDRNNIKVGDSVTLPTL